MSVALFKIKEGEIFGGGESAAYIYRVISAYFYRDLGYSFLIALQIIMQLPEERKGEILKNTCGSLLSEYRIPVRYRIIASAVYDIPGALPIE